MAEWDHTSKGMKLPYHAKRGGAIQAALNAARKYADGGGVDEWENLPKSPEGRPQITVTKPQTPGDLVAKYAPQVHSYANKALDWFSQPSEIKPETPPAPEFNPAPGQEIGTAVRDFGAGYLQNLQQLASPFVSDEDLESYKHAPISPVASADGKVPQTLKDPIAFGAPIAGEVVSTLAGSPGTGAGWAALKAAGFGINKAAIAFGIKAAQQSAKSIPKIASIATKVAAEQGFLDTSKFTQVGHQLGYMPGGVYKDPSGVPYYLKFGTDLEQAKNENLASKLYQLAGTPAAETSVTHIGGKPGIASKLLPNSHQLSESKVPYNQIPGLHDNFVVDAWLANHDAVGTGGENPLGNIMIQDGKAVRIDGGGALRFKGSGQPKKHFNDEADEISTMRDPNFSERSAQVFGDISPADLKAGAQKVADVDIQKLADAIARYGPTDDNEKTALLSKLLRRRQYIMEHFGVQPKNAAQPTHELPLNPTNMPRTYEQIPFTEEDYQNWGDSIPTSVPDDTSRAVQAIKPESHASAWDDLVKAKELKPLVIPPKELVYTLSQFLYGPQYVAKKLVNAYGDDVSKIGNAMYRLATAKSPEFVDELYKKLPFEIQVGANGELSELTDKYGDPWAENFKNKIPTPVGKRILDHLEPISDWQSYIPKIGKFEAPVFPDEATKKLAEKTGHNINVLFWKGHYKAEKYPEEFKDFSKKATEKANFLTHEKAIAASGNYGPNKAELVARATKAFRVDYEDLFGKATYDSEVHDVIEAARTKGADVLVIDNIKDYGTHIGSGFTHRQTQYAFINQNVLRAPHAKFDPDKLHLAKPLLGLAGGGLFVYGTVSGQEKDKMNRGGIPALLHKAKKMARGGPGDMSGGYHPRHPAGMIKSSIPGRTDKIPMVVPPGSYILPADVPSALGQGNTMAGEKILGTMFRSGPYSPGSTGQLSGKLPGALHPPRLPRIRALRMGKFADGGSEEQTGNEDVPIIAAGGEWVIHPDQVREVGHGDLNAGHRVLDKFVIGVRKQNIQTLKSLKPPKK